MADPYIGEIRAFSFVFPPLNWAVCNGALLSINQNPALFSIIGNRYGGSYPNTFALPNLQGRVPVGSGTGQGLTPRTIATSLGIANVALVPANMPAHTHNVNIEAAGGRTGAVTGPDPTVQYLAPASFGTTTKTAELLYSKTVPSDNNLAANALSSFGGDTSGNATLHENRQPALALNVCIALQGLYPMKPSS